MSSSDTSTFSVRAELRQKRPAHGHNRRRKKIPLEHLNHRILCLCMLLSSYVEKNYMDSKSEKEAQNKTDHLYHEMDTSAVLSAQKKAKSCAEFSTKIANQRRLRIGSDGILAATSSAFQKLSKSLTWKELIKPREEVQDADEKFFESFSALQWKLENTKRQLTAFQKGDDELKMSKEAQKLTIQFGQMTRLTQRELEMLYVEVLYTVRHKLGAKTAQDANLTRTLYHYAQDAFRVSQPEHERLLLKASEEKPPVLMLNVIVVEAQNLMAKDANGLSDPYCMLGIIPGKRRNELEDDQVSPEDSLDPASPPHDRLSPGATDETLRHTRRESIMKKIGSFRTKRRGGGSAAEIKDQRMESTSSIPAKLIKATSVRRESLNPQWNEKFQFDLEDQHSDKFHLDIWDHDDESSVVEAAKKLNEVASLKGLGRYFKQVAQSARSGADEAVDDFLGCVTCSLENLPSSGYEEWYFLEGRSQKSKVCGKIRLKLWLGTREERQGHDADEGNIIDVKQHEEIIRVFTEHELRHFTRDPQMWSGRLPQSALTILHQHAIQGDITSLQQAMCYWLSHSKIHLDTHLDWRFLYRTLEDLLTAWAPTVLSKDEEDLLAESFSEFLTHCYDIIVRHRDVLPGWDKEASISKLESMLKCLTLLHSSELFKKCLPFQRELVGELHSLIKKSAIGYFERARHTLQKETRFDSDSFSSMAYLVTVVNAGCNKALKVYHEPFKRAANINYFLQTYREFDRLLDSNLGCVFEWNHLVACDLDSQLPGAQQEALLPVFELYLALSEFFGYREYLTDSEKVKLRTCDYSKWFESAITRWMMLAKEKAMQRVDRACQLDKHIDAPKTEAQQSTSYVDVCFTLQQIVEFWDRLDLPNVKKNAELTEQLVQSLCKSAEYYADKVFAFLAHAGFFDDHATITEAVIKQMCITVNNAEQARRIVKDLPDKLHFDDMTSKIQTYCSKGVAVQWRSSVDHLVESCDTCISGQIEMVMNKNIERRQDSLEKHIFHLSWSPQGCAAELAAKPLLEDLDSYLIDFHRWLLHRNFVRLLLSQLKAVLIRIQLTVSENHGKEPEFYRRLFDSVGILVDFFHADGKGVALDTVQELKVYQELMSVLSLNQTSTTELIEQFYNELLKEQDNVNECKYGILNVRAYYNATAANLVVDVISAKHVIPLDPNGLSDPFVIVELVPVSRFRYSEVKKTRVVHKNLNPIFDETFEFTMVENPRQGDMLHFIVMDHDFLLSNDFAGEAFLDLSDVPGVSSTNTPQTLRQFNLILMHPSVKDSGPYLCLETRKEDKDALDFVKHVEIVRNR